VLGASGRIARRRSHLACLVYVALCLGGIGSSFACRGGGDPRFQAPDGSADYEVGAVQVFSDAEKISGNLYFWREVDSFGGGSGAARATIFAATQADSYVVELRALDAWSEHAVILLRITLGESAGRVEDIAW